jgi:PEP-CTERM motif
MRNAKGKNGWRRNLIAGAAIATAISTVPAIAGTTTGEVTVSMAGSTALKNWLVKSSNTFTDVQPGSQLNIGGTEYPTSTNEWSVADAYQLAPKAYSGPSTVTGGPLDSSTAFRVEFHESGSVEGILEMVSDQISPVTYVTQNVNRDPNAGNAVWVNYNQFGGGAAQAGPGVLNGYTLGNFYSSGTFVLGGTNTAAFVNTPGSTLGPIGTNINGGQNAVQLATADVIPVQAFQNISANSTATNPNFNTPWLSNPFNPGYGQGNTNLPAPAGYIGTPGSRATFQSPTTLDYPAGTTSPTGTTFTSGPWNSAGLANLNSQTIAVTATLFVANPGTGLTQVNKTDAQFLELTSRLPNGAGFNMTTRDVNSGTRNVAALETGIDPTWASGLNDDGNGNAANGLINTSGTVGQVQIGPGLRFSNKTSGGNELRPTVQANRMSIGTLSINDANGSTLSNSSDPIRALSYSNTAAGQTAIYVAPNFFSIQNGTYTIFQNEQFVSLEAPDANYGTSNPDILGDDTNGDVKNLEDNTLDSVAAGYNATNGFTPASPFSGLESQGYIPPSYMMVQKAYNGGSITTNPNFNSNAFSADPEVATLESKMNNAAPGTVLSGAGSSVYGGSTADATTPGFNGQINLTSTSDGTGGNYMFGNFNQTGVRDYDSSVVQALSALTYLEASGLGNSGFSGSNNNTTLPLTQTISGNLVALSAPLAAMPNSAGGVGATKGDLITMGDYVGAGTFTGEDLYQMAVNCSLSDATDRPTETNVDGTLVFTTGTITATASNYGSVIDSTVLNKNVALDYLNQNATAQEKQEARAVLEGPTVPSGATSLGADAIAPNTVDYTFDPNGANAFNKSDVNRDGTVDFNDAVDVDGFNGQSYTSLANDVSATILTPVTGVTEPASLVLMQQVDGEAAIGTADVQVVNTAMTGVGNANWYDYNLRKVGPGTIIWGRTGGTVTVYPTASLEVSVGDVQIGGTLDPFTDNTGSGSPTNGNHVGLAIDSGGQVQITQTPGLVQVASLSVGVGGQMDIGSSAMLISPGVTTESDVQQYLENRGIVSAYAAANGLDVAYAAAGDTNMGGSKLATDNPGDIVIEPALPGDTDLNGSVNIHDLTNLLADFNQAGFWDEGNFNNHATVDISDLQALLTNFNVSSSLTYSEVENLVGQFGFEATPNGNGVGFTLTAVPEPASMSLLAFGGFGLLGRRRRRA